MPRASLESLRGVCRLTQTYNERCAVKMFLKTIRNLLVLAGVILIVGIIVVGMSPNFRKYAVRIADFVKNGDALKPVPEPKSVRVIIKEIFPINEYGSLRVNKICRIELKDRNVIWGPISIPWSERYLAYDIPITLKLGIDCEKIEIDAERKDSLRITFPPIKILSAEQDLKDARIIERDGVLHKVTIEVQHKLVAKEIERIKDSIITNADIIRLAEYSTEHGFRSLLALHPAIPPPVFKWMGGPPGDKSVPEIEIKGESGRAGGGGL